MVRRNQGHKGTDYTVYTFYCFSRIKDNYFARKKVNILQKGTRELPRINIISVGCKYVAIN